MTKTYHQITANIIKTVALVVALAISSQAAAAVLPAFANGDFEGFVGNTNVHNSGVPPGWTTTGGTPDTFSGDTDFASYTWESSSTGGDFLHGIGQQPSWTESAVQDALGGLTIGQEYEISFEQSISRSIWSQTGGFWRITFGTEAHDSDLMTIPDDGVFEGWDWQTMLFTATAETQSLFVSAISDTDNMRTDIGIDSFFLGEPGTNPDNPDNPPDDDDDDDDDTAPVPEPSIIALFALGLFGIGFARRRKA